MTMPCLRTYSVKDFVWRLVVIGRSGLLALAAPLESPLDPE